MKLAAIAALAWATLWGCHHRQPLPTPTPPYNTIEPWLSTPDSDSLHP